MLLFLYILTRRLCDGFIIRYAIVTFGSFRDAASPIVLLLFFVFCLLVFPYYCFVVMNQDLPVPIVLHYGRSAELCLPVLNPC